MEAALPFRALLRGTGIGKLIKRLVKDRRVRADDGERPERPRIMITGASTQTLTCLICMGNIKEGSEFCTCGSGRVFHSSCLSRLGSCPYCKRTYAVKGRESTTTRHVIEPIASAPKDKPSPPPPPPVEEDVRCPVCKEEIAEDAGSCPGCGAIFIIDGGTFNCPSCGTEMGEDERKCPTCGEPFRQFVRPTCPVCRRPVGQDDKICSCGAVLGEFCPECGIRLPEEDTVCKNCGAVFEFI